MQQRPVSFAPNQQMIQQQPKSKLRGLVPLDSQEQIRMLKVLGSSRASHYKIDTVTRTKAPHASEVDGTLINLREKINSEYDF